MARAVVVTGASTGIGRACALRLDDKGWRVFAGVRKKEDAESLRAEGSSRLQPVTIDVADQDSIAGCEKEVRDALGDAGLQGLVNNAGITVQGPLEYLPLDDLRRQLEVNVVGQLACTQAFLPLIRHGRGRIVFMGSVAGRTSSPPLLGPYAASKQALEALTDALRIELTSSGIRVSIIEPGTIATPIWEKGEETFDDLIEALPEEGRERYQKMMENGRAFAQKVARRGASPEKVADKVEHALVSPRPRTRYLVGDAILRVALERPMPDKVRDRFLLKLLDS